MSQCVQRYGWHHSPPTSGMPCQTAILLHKPVPGLTALCNALPCHAIYNLASNTGCGLVLLASMSKQTVPCQLHAVPLACAAHGDHCCHCCVKAAAVAVCHCHALTSLVCPTQSRPWLHQMEPGHTIPGVCGHAALLYVWWDCRS